MRRVAMLLFLAMVLLPGGSILAQSDGPYDAGWQAAGSSGAQFVADAGYRIDFTLGQDTPPLVSAGDAYQVVQGYWAGSGGPVRPLPVAGLRASIQSGRLRLDWAAVTRDVEGDNIAGATYDVYRAENAPYFTPGTAYLGGLTDTWLVDPDPGVIGTAAHCTCYLVRASCYGLQGGASGRVGAFVFELTPGN